MISDLEKLCNSCGNLHWGLEYSLAGWDTRSRGCREKRQSRRKRSLTHNRLVLSVGRPKADQKRTRSGLRVATEPSKRMRQTGPVHGDRL
uniref:Uncharacterized protein n=1 Tax=Knipowitschia caucasica TaxID=637954 RepID=A0AAV2LI45_KNICA